MITKKQNTRDSIWYNSVHIKCLEKKVNLVVAWGQIWGARGQW